MKTTLRTKFIVFSTVLIAGIMISFTYFFTYRELAEKRASVKSQIQRIAQNIATTQLLDRQNWSVYQNYISQLMAVNADIVYIAIYDDRNTLRAHALNDELLALEMPVQSRRIEAEIIRRLESGGIAAESREDMRTERVNIMIGDRVLGSVHIGFSVIDINRDLRNGILMNAILGGIFILAAAAVAWLISQRLTRPLERLNRAMLAINDGRIPAKVTPQTHDEIAELAHSFNQMVDGLSEREIIENLGNELGASFQFDRLAVLIRDRLSSAIGAANARLYIKDRHNAAFFREMTARSGDTESFPPLSPDAETLHFLTQNREGFMIKSAPGFVLKSLRHEHRREDGLVMPMTVKDELFGMLFFELPPDQPFYSKRQIHFAATLASQAALALENALLYEDLREQERMKRELEIAREVQRKLLPAKMPQLNGFSIDGVCVSATEVGGDYFDFFYLPDGKIGIAIADVSGHGASASFYMAEIKGMMLQLTKTHHSPRKLLVELNEQLFHNTDRHIFVTMTYGILDPQTRQFTFARAGHSPTLQVRDDGDSYFFTPGGIGLGLDRGSIFNKYLEECEIALKHGDLIVLYTDGITEAMNTENEMFGDDRLQRIFDDNHRASLAETRDLILQSVQQYSTGENQQDDMTLVLVYCNA